MITTNCSCRIRAALLLGFRDEGHGVDLDRRRVQDEACDGDCRARRQLRAKDISPHLDVVRVVVERSEVCGDLDDVSGTQAASIRTSIVVASVCRPGPRQTDRLRPKT